VRRLEDGIRASLERVDPGAVLAPAREGFEPGRLHPAEPGQLRHARDIHRAPDALRLPRREADRVALLVDAAADPVDPPEAQRLVDGFGPGEARLARAPLEESDDQLGLLAVVRL
jgi:hypothetical protein